MATIRTKKAFKNILKYPTRKEAMEKANFSPSYANSGHILKTNGWQELMEKYLPDNDLAKVHQEGLSANKIITSHTEPDKEYPDYGVRHKYLETAYKIKGRLKEWEGEEGTSALTQNILVLINKVYGTGKGNTSNAQDGEKPRLSERSG